MIKTSTPWKDCCSPLADKVTEYSGGWPAPAQTLSETSCASGLICYSTNKNFYFHLTQQRPKQAELLGKVAQHTTGPAGNRLKGIFRNRNGNRTQRKQRNIIPTPVLFFLNVGLLQKHRQKYMCLEATTNSACLRSILERGFWKPEFWTKLAGAWGSLPESQHQLSASSPGSFPKCLSSHVSHHCHNLHTAPERREKATGRHPVLGVLATAHCPISCLTALHQCWWTPPMPSGLEMLATSLTEIQEQRHTARVNLRRGTCSIPLPFKYAWWKF